MENRKLNIELFKKVREKIATTPEAYDQEAYGRKEDRAPCGTAACIAGWACVLANSVDLAFVRNAGSEDEGRQVRFSHIHNTAAGLLGLSDEEAESLFTGEPEGEWADYDDDGDDIFENGWPEPFATDWRHATRAERPAIAVAYLDKIISTGKVLE